MSTSRYAPARVSAAEKAHRAVQLKIAGLNWEEIAKQVGYRNKGTAYNTVKRYLDQRQTVDVEELRRLENDRLDRLQAAVWPAAIRGDVPAGAQALKIIARRIDLNGLAAPERHEVVTLDATEAAIRELSQQLGIADPEAFEGLAGLAAGEDPAGA